MGVYSFVEECFIEFYKGKILIYSLSPAVLARNLLDPIKLLTNQRNGFTGLGHLLGDGEHEDAEGEDYGDAEGNLLARVRGQAEDEYREAGHHHAREHNVVHVVQGLPTNSEIWHICFIVEI